MIAKHVPMRSAKKSDFSELVAYLTDSKGTHERVGAVRLTNCAADTSEDAVLEILATQHCNTRAASDKTYHLLISFRAGEHPAEATLRAIEDRVCTGLGFADHQRISVVHHDTDNLHIHIAINKIHPQRNTIHEPYYSHRALADLCARCEHEFRLETDNHEARRRGAEARAADMERHAGVESLVGWVKRECLSALQQARTWEELHDLARKNGLSISTRGNGLVFQAQDGTTVKGSTLSRAFSKSALERRFGPFLPQAATGGISARAYQKAPLRHRIDTSALYERYQAERSSGMAVRQSALEQARALKNSEFEAAKRTNRLRRAAIKLLNDNAPTKRLLYAQAHQSLRTKLRSITTKYRVERQSANARNKRLTWADWLRQEAMNGNREALAALRAREQSQGLRGNTLAGNGKARPGFATVRDHITKKGTIVFRAGDVAVRDDGDKLQVSRAITRTSVAAALRLAIERYGDRITVNGSVEFKAQVIRVAVDASLSITFADPLLESRRQALLTRENTHDRPNERSPHRGGSGRGAGDTGQRTPANFHPGRASILSGASNNAGQHRGVHGKPDVGRIGRDPPPQSRHRLRALSQLNVVRIAGGSEVLLPRDVPRGLEHQGAERTDALRREISRPAVTDSALTAAEAYISERESKRLKGFDIPKHSRYTEGQGLLSFNGTRRVEGQSLALLKRGDEVLVMPVDAATAQRLSRLAIGDPVAITPRGSIKTSKGMTR